MNERDITSERELWLRVGEALMYLFAYTAVLVIDVIGMYAAIFGPHWWGGVDVGAAYVTGGLLIRTEPKKRTRNERP